MSSHIRAVEPAPSTHRPIVSREASASGGRFVRAARREGVGKRRAAREAARPTTCQCAAQELPHRVSSGRGTILIFIAVFTYSIFTLIAINYTCIFYLNSVYSSLVLCKWFMIQPCMNVSVLLVPLSGILLLPGYVYLVETVSVLLEQEQERLLAHLPHFRARSAPSLGSGIQ